MNRWRDWRAFGEQLERGSEGYTLSTAAAALFGRHNCRTVMGQREVPISLVKDKGKEQAGHSQALSLAKGQEILGVTRVPRSAASYALCTDNSDDAAAGVCCSESNGFWRHPLFSSFLIPAPADEDNSARRGGDRVNKPGSGLTGGLCSGWRRQLEMKTEVRDGPPQ